MADSRTSTILKRRKAAKVGGSALAGVLLGLGLKGAFGLEPVGAFLNTVQTVAGWFPQLVVWLDGHPDARAWIVGPVAFGVLFLTVSALPWFRRRVLDRLFPDPPPFVRSDLDEARRRERMISLEGPPLPFVGREAELAELEELLGEPERPFAWRALTGVSGIGKTRLGIEWLEAAKVRGWDVGIVDREDSALLRDWRPRRGTALVVDEARRDWDDGLGELLATLAKAGSARRPVRALVIDQILPFADLREGENRDVVRAAVRLPPLRLPGLEDAKMGALCAASGQTRLDAGVVLRESAGRPRAALILLNARDATSYAGALSEWAERFVPGLADSGTPLTPALAGPLFLAALVGPVATDVARELFGPVDAGPLVRFYGAESRESLERQLPPLHPDDLAQELVLRLFPRIDAKLREQAVDRVIADRPGQVEARLGGIWRDRPELNAAGRTDGPAAALRWLQQRFDASAPDRLEAIRFILSEMINSLSQPTVKEDELRLILANIVEILRTRPFDPDFQSIEFAACCNAILRLGEVGDIDLMEKWCSRILDILVEPRFKEDSEIQFLVLNSLGYAMNVEAEAGYFERMEDYGKRLEDLFSNRRNSDDLEAQGVMVTTTGNVMLHYGRAKQFEGMERWGAKLVTLTEDPRFRDDPDLKSLKATVAVNAMQNYATAGNSNGLEGWGAKLAEIGDTPAVRIAQAAGAMAGTLHYRLIGDLEGLRRWGDRLRALAGDARSVDTVEMAQELARGAVNMITGYGAARRFGALEQWGAELVALADNDRFSANQAIREAEAMGANNAIRYYESPEHFDALERWAHRLIALVEDRRFSGNPTMRLSEAKAATNAISHYGHARRFDDLERWGTRLIALADDPRFADDSEIRLWELKGADNAHSRYAEAGRHDWPPARKWRKRIALVSLAFPTHSEIQYWAAQYELDITNQMRAGNPFGRPRLARRE